MGSSIATDVQRNNAETTDAETTMDSLAVFATLWQDKGVGYAILEVIEQGEAFRFISLNAAMARLLQGSLKDTTESATETQHIKGKTLSATLSAATAQQLRYPCDRCIHTQEAASFEVCLPTTDPSLSNPAIPDAITQPTIDQSTRWWQLKAHPLTDSLGQICQLVLVANEITDFKHKEARLQTAIKDARTIFDNTQEAIFIHELNGQIIDVNEQVLKMHQITRGEALRFSIEKEYARADSPTHLLPELWQRVTRGERVELEWPSQRQQDGSRLDLEVVLQRVVLSKQPRIMACVRDITERKKIEAEQNRLLNIIEGTPDLVGIADARGNSLYLNQAGQQILGMSKESSRNFHISDTMLAKHRATFANHVLPQAIREGSWSGEWQLLTRTGEELPVSMVLMAHKGEQGALKYLSVIMRDISPIKAVEARLRDREQFLNSIYTGAEIVIFAWDLVDVNTQTFKCSGWNPTCEAATGISAQQTIGKTPAEVFGPEQGAAVVQNCLQCVSTGQPFAFEEKILLEDMPTWWATKLNPIYNEAGQVYRIVGTTTNITELKLNSMALEAYGKRQAQQAQELSTALAEVKRTQSQIVQNEKMSSLGQMVAGIAHEINNPVNFIHANIKPARGYAAELLEIIEQYQKECPAPSPALAEMLEESDLAFIQEDFLNLLESMKLGTQRIREIVLSLRNFSRLDESDIKAVDLHEGIDSTLIILAHRLREKSGKTAIKITKDYPPATTVACYPSQLNQVVMNILSNAIDVLGNTSDPEVIIHTQACDGQAVLTICDNGPAPGFSGM